jgi:glycosyltransferase involved in cell wall biosynthesis
MPGTLYLTRNGLLEPLGQSQVMGYLKGLSEDYRITLITHEKTEDLANTHAMASARADCEAHDINWRPKSFRHRPKLLAPGWCMFEMFWSALQAAWRGEAGLIHARSYLPAAVAWAVFRLTGTPFIFDMRALWPEELITAGRLRRGSMMHKVLVGLERRCLRDAALVVSLTEAATHYLKQQYPNELEAQKITIIPTCTNLERFKLSSEPPSARVYGCIGTVLSGWFRLDWLAGFYLQVAARDHDALFEVVTRDDKDAVRSVLDPDGILGDRLAIYPLPSDRVQEALQKQSVSVMFYAGGEASELGRSPTRMGEVLGCGVPVVANEGVGDVADIIRRYNVGVIVKDGSEAAMTTALDELETLRSDPNLPSRCRQAAEEVFSLEAGTEAYRKIYADILGRPDGPAAAPAAPNAANDR